ncbi:MAG TPA: nickel pincer cofactor biosynthesis protein LarC [Acidimicrobiales bacterium]|nr:nickel pincer cofactor biosynthesis protein LarC [Acidimicrobiales bacterium]
MADRSTVAWFHCFSGIAGDMALGALLDAGADIEEVRAILGRLPVPGWALRADATVRGGIAATQAVVEVEPTTVTRTWANIDALLDEARLPDRVRRRATDTFAAIATVEARLHRRPVEQVHFHELGGVDAIVDIVGVAAALEVLGVDRVTASPVATGMGMVRTSHGLLPNPAPAVVELLVGAPTYGTDVAVELTTPTGAGLLAALAEGWGPLPPMTVTSSGFGAGSHDLAELPNLTRVVIGEEATSSSGGHPVVVLETNVDDVTGETLAHTLAVLLEAGAHDAWVAPVVMKKGRPAHLVGVLVDPADAGRLASVLAGETGTLGVRATSSIRWPAPRHVEVVEVDGYTVRVKVAGGDRRRAKVEHDDAAALARRLGVPLVDAVRRVDTVWRQGGEDGAAAVVELAARPGPGPGQSPNPGGEAG